MKTDRLQVNLRLDRELLAELDQLARHAHLDRPELARQILREGVARRREEDALQAYADGHVTAWRAAEMAGLSLYEMLDRIHQRGVIHEIDPEELEAIRRMPVGEGAAPARSPITGTRRRVAEVAAVYGTDTPPSPRPDTETGIDALRARYRPSQVRNVLVGESSPAGGTHFYLANSNLFRAVREAFVVALAPDPVPNGDAFLALFADRGYWLVDLADEPVNRMPHAPRKEAVEAGVDRLRATIEELRPERIIAIEASVGHLVRQAVEAAGSTAPVDVLPFPVRQWRAQFVDRLATIAGGSAAGQSPAETKASVPTDADDVLTQRITEADLRRGQIRIPSTGRSKSFFPGARGRIDVVVRGQSFNAHYDPHYDPDQQRSGVLRIGSQLASLVRAEERLRITRSADGAIALE